MNEKVFAAAFQNCLVVFPELKYVVQKSKQELLKRMRHSLLVLSLAIYSNG